MYIVKHNIPNIGFKESIGPLRKNYAIATYQKIKALCIRKGYNCKNTERLDSTNEPIRATIEVEVDGFSYYAELFSV